MSLTDIVGMFHCLCLQQCGGSYVFSAKGKSSFYLWHLFDGVYAYFAKYLLEVFRQRICVTDIGHAILLSDLRSILSGVCRVDTENWSDNISSYLMLFCSHYLDEDHAGGVRYMVWLVKAGRVLVGEGITKTRKT